MTYPVKIQFKEYSGTAIDWYTAEDWSQYLVDAPQINRRVESENEGEAGVIVFDNASVTFLYKWGFGVKLNSNIGGGKLVFDSDTPVLSGAKAGIYTLRCNSAAGGGGTFEVKDPEGTTVGLATIGIAFSDELKFIINAGAPDFVVGDGFDVTVSPVYLAFSGDLNDKERYLFRISAPKSDKSYVQLFEGVADFSTINWPGDQNIICFEIIDKLSSLGVLQTQLTRTEISLKDRVLAQLSLSTFIDFIYSGIADEVWIAAGHPDIYESFTTKVVFTGEVIKIPALLSPIGTDWNMNYYVIVESTLAVNPFWPGVTFNKVKFSPAHSNIITNNYRYGDDSAYQNDSWTNIKCLSKEVYGLDINNITSGILQSLNGLAIIQALYGQVWGSTTIIKKPSGLSFGIPSEYAVMMIDEFPLGQSPLDALKTLSNSMRCYVYINNAGDLVIQSKDDLPTNGTIRTFKQDTVMNVLISDPSAPNFTTPNHPVLIRNAFLAAYPDFPGTFFFRQDMNQSTYDYARANNCGIVIRSTTGITGFISMANQNYPILTFFPAGSNSFVHVYNSNGSLPSGIVVTGAGDNNNETGYDVEFFAPDPVNIEPDLSSYSNGFIAGQILYIKNTLGCSIFQARQWARQNATNGTWNMYDGFGKINTEDAVNVDFPGTNTRIISRKKKYFWDKLVDGVTIKVKSWVIDDAGEYLTGESNLTKEIYPGSGKFIDKPKNSITKEVLASNSTMDTQEALNSFAATMASDYMTFYGNRRSSLDLVLSLDDNTIDWELVDNLIYNSIQYFFTAIELDLIERTITLTPVEVEGHPYDFRQVIVGLSEENSTSVSSGGSSSSGGTTIINNERNVIYVG